MKDVLDRLKDFFRDELGHEGDVEIAMSEELFEKLSAKARGESWVAITNDSKQAKPSVGKAYEKSMIRITKIS